MSGTNSSQALANIRSAEAFREDHRIRSPRGISAKVSECIGSCQTQFTSNLNLGGLSCLRRAASQQIIS